MAFLSQKKNILKKAVKRNGANLDFPELDMAEDVITKEFPTTIRGTRPITNIHGDVESFGKKLRNPEFKKQFRKMQEKYKVTSYA